MDGLGRLSEYAAYQEKSILIGAKLGENMKDCVRQVTNGGWKSRRVRYLWMGRMAAIKMNVMPMLFFFHSYDG